MEAASANTVFTCWTVTPVEPPVVERHCPGCGATRRFQSSGRFRVNANRRLLDVWLIYRCVTCSRTWNLPVVERCDAGRLDPGWLKAVQHNDTALALDYACDVSRLRRHVASVATPREFRVDVRPTRDNGPWEHVRIEMSLPCKVRLDRLLCHVLEVSRTELGRLVDRELVRIDRARLLARPVRDGQTLRIASRQ